MSPSDARVLVAPEAQVQIDEIDTWWRENRTAAPDLFFQELSSAITLLAAAPGLGKRYPHATVPGIRRILLRATRYHIYYVAHDETVVVIAVWNAQRGTGPDLQHLR